MSGRDVGGATLWCVHVIGPDDVHAAPDFDTAEQWAIRQNALMRKYTVDAGMEDDPYWPQVRAVVAVWPWSAEGHAADLPNSIRDFTPPSAAAVAPHSVHKDT